MLAELPPKSHESKTANPAAIAVEIKFTALFLRTPHRSSVALKTLSASIPATPATIKIGRLCFGNLPHRCGQAPPCISDSGAVGGKPVAGFEVFAGQKWAEPSEPIAESLLVALPRADGHIYRLALKVVSVRIWWTAETIVEDFLIVVTRGGRHDDHTIPDHGRG